MDSIVPPPRRKAPKLFVATEWLAVGTLRPYKRFTVLDALAEQPFTVVLSHTGAKPGDVLSINGVEMELL